MARDFAKGLNEGLEAADTDALVNGLLEEAHAFTATAEAALDASLEDIMSEARAEPGLASRMDELE